MLGVTVNFVAIVLGSFLGILFRRWITPSLENTVQKGLGFCTLIVGVKMALRLEHILVVIACVVVGGIVGELLGIDARMERLGEFVRKLTTRKDAPDARFSVGFSLCSILYCTGAMAIMGSIESSLQNNHETLFTKSMMDGIFSAPMAAIYGIGVAFSGVSVFLYQGLIVVLAKSVHAWSDPSVMNDISGVGGILVAMIGAKVAKISDVSLGSYFPAVFLILLAAPLLH